MSVDDHKKSAPETVSCSVITVSDTRTKDTDKSGKIIKELLADHHHHVLHHSIVKDEEPAIKQAIEDAKLSGAEVVLLNGGTGIAMRDVTYEVVQGYIDKELPGFGELFRYLSYVEDIGSAAILSRAVAGTSGDAAVFSMPGSSGAVKLAMNRLILPELSHIVHELKK